MADEGTMIAGLRRAHEASPDNGALLALLLSALLDAGRTEEATETLDASSATLSTPSDRRAAARVRLSANDPEAALRLLDDDTPESALLVARAHLLAGRLDAGRAVYERAVAANRTLEDPELRRKLEVRSRQVTRDGPGGPVRLAVIPGGATADAVDPLLVPESDRVSFADIGGLQEVKRQIEKRIILPYAKPSLFVRFKKKVGGGILMYGPPGCGKTLLARATAGEANARFFNVAISDVLDMWFGESELKLHRLFEEARRAAPSVLFFDEIEALGGRRQYNRDQTSAKLVSQFLSEMDGFSKGNQGVLVLAATNVPWSVDPAFRRPGRFDRVLFVPPPDREAREAILRIHLAGRPTASDVDPSALAKRTSGFSGADLSNLVETASDLAIEASLEKGEESPVTQAHLLGALAEVKPTTTEWLTTARNHARYANEGGQYDEVLAFLGKHGQ